MVGNCIIQGKKCISHNNAVALYLLLKKLLQLTSNVGLMIEIKKV